MVVIKQQRMYVSFCVSFNLNDTTPRIGFINIDLISGLKRGYFTLICVHYLSFPTSTLHYTIYLSRVYFFVILLRGRIG